MIDVNVAIVGGGPAALGAAAALRQSTLDVLIISEEPPRGWPIYLTERAQAELTSIVGSLPQGHRLNGSTVQFEGGTSSINFETNPLIIEATDWSSFLRAALTSCHHPMIEGHAQLIDAHSGMLEVEQGGNVSRVRAQTVIWATGDSPAGTNNDADADALLFSLTEVSQLDRLTFTLPAENRTTSAAIAQWRMPTRCGSAHGLLVPRTQSGPAHSLNTSGQTNLVARVGVNTTFQRARSAVGRILLVGGSAGLFNRFTGEGISYALRSGRLAGQAVPHGVNVRSEFTRSLSTEFGGGTLASSQDSGRQHQLALRAITGAIRSRSAARDRIVGLMLDQGINHWRGDGAARVAPVQPDILAARGRTQMIVARESSSLWFAAAPSLTELPTIPDIRVSDALLACAGEVLSLPRTALAAAAVDLTASSFGLLAAGISETPSEEHGRNWAEIASVAAHDLLACRSMKLAGKAGPEVLEAYLLWIDSALRLRREALGSNSTRSVLRLYESVFELPVRLAAILRGSDETETGHLVRVGHLLGAAYAYGDEIQVLRGHKSRLGLDLAQLETNHLRCPLDQIALRWKLDADEASAKELNSLWVASLHEAESSLSPGSYEMLDGMFHVGMAPSSTHFAPRKSKVAL